MDCTAPVLVNGAVIKRKAIIISSEINNATHIDYVEVFPWQQDK